MQEEQTQHTMGVEGKSREATVESDSGSRDRWCRRLRRSALIDIPVHRGISVPHPPCSLRHAPALQNKLSSVGWLYDSGTVPESVLSVASKSNPLFCAKILLQNSDSSCTFETR